MDVAVADGRARVRLAGDLDLSTVPAVRARVAALRGDGSTRIVLDLAELDFIDSTGLRLILELHGEAAQDSFTLALVPGGDAVQRVFAVTGTAGVLPFIEG
jgi:anti-anti-sigma factor